VGRLKNRLSCLHLDTSNRISGPALGLDLLPENPRRATSCGPAASLGTVLLLSPSRQTDGGRALERLAFLELAPIKFSRKPPPWHRRSLPLPPAATPGSRWIRARVAGVNFSGIARQGPEACRFCSRDGRQVKIFFGAITIRNYCVLLFLFIPVLPGAAWSTKPQAATTTTPRRIRCFFAQGGLPCVKQT